MTKEQINELLQQGSLPGTPGSPELIETHISWVILCDDFVYKIKKPIRYSFLDFSTKEKRRYYCEREIALNKRLADDLYLDVQAVRVKAGSIAIGGNEGGIIDYAVRMRKLDREKQMDFLLLKNKLTNGDIENLAEKIASFHKNTDIIYNKNVLDVRDQFKDLSEEKDHLKDELDEGCGIMITKAIAASDVFIDINKSLLTLRLRSGFFRDCHGDLHSRNIFLLPEPQPFDCIEFNDDYRHIDVLNEVAFLCMDLDAFGKNDFSRLFLACYNELFPSMKTVGDKKLFVYYKAYRANIRAKVNSLRSKNAENQIAKKAALAEARKYLHLMNAYIDELSR